MNEFFSYWGRFGNFSENILPFTEHIYGDEIFTKLKPSIKPLEARDKVERFVLN